VRTEISEKYIPGAYKREALRGYLQFLQFMNSGITVDKTRGRKIAADKLALRWVKQDVISRDTYDRYIKALLDFFDFERISEFTDEQITYQIDRLRMTILNKSERKAIQYFRKTLLAEFEAVYQRLGFPENDDAFYTRKIPYGAAKFLAHYSETNGGYEGLEDEEVLKHRYDYTFNMKLFLRLMNEIAEKKKITVIADNNIFLLLFLYEISGKFNIKDKLDCTIFMKRNPLHFDPVPEDICIEQYKALDIKIKFCQAENAGYDFRDRELLNHITENNTLLVAMGENTIMTLDGVDTEYWGITPIETDKFCKYLGVMPSFDPRETRIFIKKIRSHWHYPFKKRFTGMERSTFNLNSGVNDDKNKFMNMNSSTYSPEKFPEFLITEENWEKIVLERERLLAEKIKEFGLTYHNFRLKHKDGKNIRFDVVNIGKNQSVTPFLAQDYDKTLINVRAFKPLNCDENKKAVFINFLYFATQKLVNLYNADRPVQEHLHFNNFYIDMIYNTARNITTFPLYNKGFTGLKNGQFVFGNERLGAGKLKINDFEFAWSESLINTKSIEYRPVLFTPEFFQEHAEAFDDLIKDRINAVIVNDKLVAVRKGVVKMSAFGVVLSIPKAFENEIRKKMHLTDEPNGYYRIEPETRVIIDLDQNKGYRWKYGGGTLLVKEGENLMKNALTAKEAFMNEGWYNPLSMQTQETQVQDWVRGPRSVIGEDMDGNIFMGVFSGRTTESVGARFDEIVDIIEKKFCKIKNLLNLDGGASSCLGLIYKKEFFELSLPCATNFTCTGMVRPVNSFLTADL
jgi:hypothetical protein